MVSWNTRLLSSWGYWIFGHPEICSGDQSKISLLATIVCSGLIRSHLNGRATFGEGDLSLPINNPNLKEGRFVTIRIRSVQRRDFYVHKAQVNR